MPLAALGLKKYLGGTSRVSKTSDNEHTAPSLGHSEVLSVKHPVGPPIPEVGQGPEDRSHVPAVVRREKTRDVLDENPAGSESTSDTHELEEKP
jgi:hypothetical protein